MALASSKSGYIKVKGYSIYYEIYGDLNSGKTPLLALHGGPGSGHNNLLPLAKLANDRPVIFYDQLGTGRSQIPPNDRLYNLKYFVHELDQIQKQLGYKG